MIFHSRGLLPVGPRPAWDPVDGLQSAVADQAEAISEIVEAVANLGGDVGGVSLGAHEQWRPAQNIFPDPRLLFYGDDFPMPLSIPNTAPIVNKSGHLCIETPASPSGVTARRTARYNVEAFASGRISVSFRVHEKIGDQGADGIRVRLVAYDSMGLAANGLLWTDLEHSDLPGDTVGYVRYLPRTDIESATTIVLCEGVELPTGTKGVALDFRVGNTSVQAYISDIVVREGGDPSYVEHVPPRVAYVSPVGSDALGNGARIAPFASANRAIAALDGSGIVIFDGEEFGPQTIDPTKIRDRVVLAGTWSAARGENTIIRCSSKLSGITKTDGYTQVYQCAVPAGVTIVALNWMYQEGTPDARTAIATGHPAHGGRTHRLEAFTRILYVDDDSALSSALTEIDEADDPRCYHDDGTLYFSIVGGGDASTADIYVDQGIGLIAATGLLGRGAEIAIVGLDVRYGGINTRTFRRTHLADVRIQGAPVNCWDYAGVTTAEYVETCCSGSRDEALGDGINGHNHAKLTATGLYVHDCRDDGESAHEYSRVRIRDSYAEYNGGGAFVPALGCDAAYYDCESYRNQQISGRKFAAFLSVIEPDDGGSETLVHFYRCRSVEDAVGFGDYYLHGLTSVRAVCIECDAIDPGEYGFHVSEIRNCRHSGTGTAVHPSTTVVNSTLIEPA